MLAQSGTIKGKLVPSGQSIIVKVASRPSARNAGGRVTASRGRSVRRRDVRRDARRGGDGGGRGAWGVGVGASVGVGCGRQVERGGPVLCGPCCGAASAGHGEATGCWPSRETRCSLAQRTASLGQHATQCFESGVSLLASYLAGQTPGIGGQTAKVDHVRTGSTDFVYGRRTGCTQSMDSYTLRSADRGQSRGPYALRLYTSFHTTTHPCSQRQRPPRRPRENV